MKASELIPRVLRDIGVLGVGQTMSSEYAEEVLSLLQELMDSWQTQLSASLAFLRTAVPLTSGTRDYTIGTDATINIVRPDKVRYASFVLDSTVTDPHERPIVVYTDQQWARVCQKTLNAPSVDGIYFDRGSFASAVQGTISTYPTVDGSNRQIVLYTNALVPGNVFADLSTDYVFPPGMKLAIRYNLAKACCRPFGVQLAPDLEQDAANSFATFKRSTHQPVELTIDPILTGRGYFDPETGRYQ